MNPQELTGVALDFAVAQALNLEVAVDDNHVYLLSHPKSGVTTKTIYSPSTRWEHGGPILERYSLQVVQSLDLWSAFTNNYWNPNRPEYRVEYRGTGSTYLIAAMRCFVASNS